MFAKFLFSPMSPFNFSQFTVEFYLLLFFLCCTPQVEGRGPFHNVHKENKFLLGTNLICTKITGSLSMLQTMKIPQDGSGKTHL